MPLVFSYGTLQQEDVQLSTFGRRLGGRRDELAEYEAFSVTIDKTRCDNVRLNGDKKSRVPGMVFEITDAELARADEYEAEFSYTRVEVTLASGRQAWVYIHR